MKIERFDLIIVGAGPSGLSAAIEAAKRGMNVVVLMRMHVRADSFSSRYISFLDLRSTRQRSEASISESSFLRRQTRQE